MPKFSPISRLSERNQLLVLSLVVGIVVGLAAVLLKTLISLIQGGLYDAFEEVLGGTLYYLVLPGVGMLLAMLFCRFVIKDNIGHGVTKALQAVSRHESRIKPHNMWSSVAASSVTIGFGGSVGAEAPIVLTGSAIGSNLGQIFRMDKKTMMLLVGCGASAAIAGVFKAPIAGLVFTLEVLMVDLSMASLLPILISCVTATCFTYIFDGDSSLFEFTLTNPWELDRTPACILLGVFCGLVSLYFMRTMSICEGFFGKLGQ